MKHNKVSPSTLIIHFTLGMASALVCFVGFITIYENTSDASAKFTVENYRPYVPHILRGANEGSNLKEYFLDGKTDSVISGFNTLNAPQPEDYLLAGISFLEKKQPSKAIEMLTSLMQKNKQKNTDDFEKDAEYYLAMSYISNEEPEKAMPLLEKIQADPENPYYDTVMELPVMQMKEFIAKK